MNQEMASSVLGCEDFSSKEQLVYQHSSFQAQQATKSGFQARHVAVRAKRLRAARVCYEPGSNNEVARSLHATAPKNVSEDMCREDHDVLLKKRRLFSTLVCNDSSEAELVKACRVEKLLCNSSTDYENGGENLKNHRGCKLLTPSASAVRAVLAEGKSLPDPGLYKAQCVNSSRAIQALSEHSDPSAESHALPQATPENLSIAANEDGHPALHTSNLGFAANGIRAAGEVLTLTGRCNLQNELAVEGELPHPDSCKQQNSAVEEKKSFLSREGSRNGSLKKRESLDISYRSCSGTKSFDFRAIAKNFDGVLMDSPNYAGSRYSECGRFLQPGTITLTQAHYNDTNVPSMLELIKNCDPMGKNWNYLSAPTPIDFSHPVPDLVLMPPVQTSPGLSSPVPVPIDSSPLVPALNLKDYSSAVYKLCEPSIEPAHSHYQTTRSDIHEEEDELEETNNYNSTRTDVFHFKAAARNYDVGCVRANNFSSLFSTKTLLQRDRMLPEVLVHSESEIPTRVRECSARITLDPKLAFRRQNKRRKSAYVSQNVGKEKKRALTELSVPSSCVNHYTSATQWAGGEVTISPKSGVMVETFQSTNCVVSADDHGRCDISSDDSYQDSALSSQQETYSVLDDYSRASDNTLQEGISVSIGCGRRASVGYGDSNYSSEDVSMTGTGGTADDCNISSFFAIATEGNGVPAAGSLSSCQDKLFEKLVSVDAKLTEDVGNEAEKVVTFGDSQDPGVSMFRSYLVPKIETPGLRCSFCHQLFTCYSSLEGHAIERHSKGWRLIKNSFLRTLVPFHPEGFAADHPQMTFKCVFCSKLFSCRSALSVHVTERHYGDEPYECPFCSKRFNDPHPYSYHLDAHVLLADYPSYKCQVCALCFSDQWQLDLHSEIHERLSPVVVD